MKIIKVREIKCYLVETDENEYNQYTRYSSVCWDITRGESDEPVYYFGEIESLFQECIKKDNQKKESIVSRQHHFLKCETKYFQAMEKGKKKFELRVDDRGYKRFDMVYFKEVVNGVETGRELPPVEIQYVLRDGDADRYGLKHGYCIFNW